MIAFGPSIAGGTALANTIALFVPAVVLGAICWWCLRSARRDDAKRQAEWLADLAEIRRVRDERVRAYFDDTFAEMMRAESARSHPSAQDPDGAA